jgi:hypothetical protein
MYDTQENFKHTSPLVNRLSYERRGGARDRQAHLLYRINRYPQYDFCRDDPEFAELLEKLKESAK